MKNYIVRKGSCDDGKELHIGRERKEKLADCRKTCAKKWQKGELDNLMKK